ncbi:unnamed protein product [Pylaiella littoralis]
MKRGKIYHTILLLGTALLVREKPAFVSDHGFRRSMVPTLLSVFFAEMTMSVILIRRGVFGCYSSESGLSPVVVFRPCRTTRVKGCGARSQTEGKNYKEIYEVLK